MEKLDISKAFLVECMEKVLYESLVGFFSSIGKQKHHISKFEEVSSQSEAEEEKYNTSPGKVMSSYRRRSRSRN